MKIYKKVLAVLVCVFTIPVVLFLPDGINL